jgi:hypothetical protein
MEYTGYVGTVIAIMVLGLVIFLLTVKEKKWADEMEADTLRLGLAEATEEKDGEKKGKLDKGQLISLILILASVALWFIG